MSKTKAIKGITIAAFTVVYFLTVKGIRAQEGTFDGINPLYAMFLHANIAHLIVNMTTLWAIWRKPMWLIVPAMMLGILGMALSNNVVGFSAALFALMGLQWHIYDCKRNWIIIGVALLLSLVLPQLAFIAHIVPFTLGWIINRAWKMHRQFQRDTNWLTK